MESLSVCVYSNIDIHRTQQRVFDSDYRNLAHSLLRQTIILIRDPLWIAPVSTKRRPPLHDGLTIGLGPPAAPQGTASVLLPISLP